jgi:hypothetical protein
MKYKVWIEVEEIEEERDHYQTLPFPEELGCFDTEEEAWELLRQIASEGRTP